MSVTLEKFLDTYLKNKKLDNEAKSYADWLERNASDPSEDYEQQLRQIETDYQRAQPGYGARAEELGTRGLNGGYADYLSGKAYATRQQLLDRARRQYRQHTRETRKGYAQYLDEYRTAQQSATRAAADSIRSSGSLDYNTAYQYALSVGLNDENAKAAATEGIGAAKDVLRKKVFALIDAQSLSRPRAIAYALNLGFSEEEANEIGNYAYQMQRPVSGASYEGEDFTDYLNRLAQNAQKRQSRLKEEDTPRRSTHGKIRPVLPLLPRTLSTR